MWALIDNYDSFTYILYDYLLQLCPAGIACKVFRNDELTIAQLQELNPTQIIISPGPETPLQAGICMKVIEHFHKHTPILGICLGHQALGMFYGAKLTKLCYPMHGKTSDIMHTNHPIFEGIPSPFTAMRYHSLTLAEAGEHDLDILARSKDDNAVMVLAHKTFPSIGIQFHPESVGTEIGLKLLSNILLQRPATR